MTKTSRTRNKPSGFRSVESAKEITPLKEIAIDAQAEGFAILEDGLSFIGDLTGFYVKDCKPTETNRPTLRPAEALWRAEEIFLNVIGLKDPIYTILSPISIDDARHFLSDKFSKHFRVLNKEDRVRLEGLINQIHEHVDTVAETLRKHPGVNTEKPLPKSTELFGESRRINGTTIKPRFVRPR